MDAFCIYASGNRALIEQIYIKDEQNKIKSDLKELASGKENSEYCFLVNNDTNVYVESRNKQEKNEFLENGNDKNFVYLIKKNELQYVSLTKNESNPMLVVEMMNGIIDVLKSYFNVNKLNENILINNYSIVNFLINEILTQGKPSVFIDDILKHLIKNESSFLNETLKISPLPNSIYNMIAQKNKNTIDANIPIDENNINFSFSNGSCINSGESMFHYWRVSNNSISSTNEIYIDLIENVNCIVNEQNKVVHYGVVGNVTVNANIHGCPVIKMYIKNLNLNECTFHFTVNYSKIIKHKKLNKKENVIYFTPLNKEYTVLKYFYAHSSYFSSLERAIQNGRGAKPSNLYEELTDVLNVPKKGREHSVNTDEKNESEENIQEEENEISLLDSVNFYNPNYRYRSGIRKGYGSLSNEHLSTGHGSIGNGITGSLGISVGPKTSYLFDEDNENPILPIHLDSDIIYIETDNMYKIKISVKFNNVYKEKNSNLLLTNYENITLKIPVHKFIGSVDLHASVGSIGYVEKSHCIYWQIKSVTDKNVSTCANISLYIKQEETNNYNNSPTTATIENNHKHNFNFNNRNGNGNGNRNGNKNNKEFISFHENSLRNFIYSSFKFVVYASLKVNGISVTGKKIEKVEILGAKDINMYKGCRYTTVFQSIEFRL